MDITCLNQVKYLKDTNIDFKVIKRLMTGNLVRIDIFVLSRFCIYINCDITDIVEYIKLPKNNSDRIYIY